MIEGSRSPAASRVTDGTICREASGLVIGIRRAVVVGHVASRALCRSAGKLAAHVAAQAWNTGMLAA